MAKGTFPVGALVGSFVAHALAVLLLSTVSPSRVDAGAGPMVVEVSLVGDAGDDGEDGAISSAPAPSRGASEAPTTASSPEAVRISPPLAKPEPKRVAESAPRPLQPEPSKRVSPDPVTPAPVIPEPAVSEPVSSDPPRQVAARVTKPVSREPVFDAASGRGPVRRHDADGGAGRQGDSGKTARGQGTSGQGASGQGAGTRSAGYTLGSASCPAPAYPRMARLRGQEGRVVLRVSVAADGQVTAVDVLTSSGYSLLDRTAAQTVAGWRLDPARRAGVPVPTTETISIRFDLTTS